MSEEASPIDLKKLEAMNEKAIQNQFFTPDNCYIELGLLKDFPLGALYMETVFLKEDKELFQTLQEKLIPLIPDYQKRLYETVEPLFKDLAVTDTAIENLLQKEDYHDHIFTMSPNTKFLMMLARHTLKNQNHSRPANKYTKRSVDKDHYTLDSIPITYWFNSWPLKLSRGVIHKVSSELGEALGVNIAFICKDPKTFDQTDWDDWMEKIDCFYLDSLGRFQRSPFVLEKQGDLQFSGCYFFVRKRFEKSVIPLMQNEDFNQQIQMVTAQMSMFCDFEWIQNNDVRLTEEAEDVPMNDDQETPDPNTDAGNT